MEAVIARLLNDFESGYLTRRQLVQTLALVAVGSPVASAMAQNVSGVTQTPGTPPALRAPAAPWKTVRLDHISYRVADYKKSVEFYTGLMGWQVRDDNGRQATLDINGIGNIIIRSGRRGSAAGAAGATQPIAAPPQAAPPALGDSAAGARPARPPITGVIDHIAYGVEPWDTEAVRAELLRRGLTAREDFQGENYKSFHVRDPDGWDLQISNQTKARSVPALPARGS